MLKINKKELKALIKEELNNALSEVELDEAGRLDPLGWIPGLATRKPGRGEPVEKGDFLSSLGPWKMGAIARAQAAKKAAAAPAKKGASLFGGERYIAPEIAAASGLKPGEVTDPGVAAAGPSKAASWRERKLGRKKVRTQKGKGILAGHDMDYDKFYSELEKHGLTDLLGKAGEDKQWGKGHKAAFEALQAAKMPAAAPLSAEELSSAYHFGLSLDEPMHGKHKATPEEITSDLQRRRTQVTDSGATWLDDPDIPVPAEIWAKTKAAAGIQESINHTISEELLNVLSELQSNIKNGS